MLTRVRNVTRVLLCALLAAAAACASGSSSSKSATRTPAPREAAARALNAAQKAIAVQDYEAALAVLAKAQASGKLDDSERALVLGRRAQVYTLEKNYPEAIQSYEQALGLHALGDADAQLYAFNLGQLYIAMKRYDDAIRELDGVAQRQGGASPEVSMGLANAYWGKNQGARALPLAESAVERRRDAPESWLRLLASLYLEEGQPAKAAAVLERGLDEGRIEPSVKTLDALATAWFKAGDPAKAEAVLARAASSATDGRADLRLGQLLVEEQKWAPATTALESALAKGGLDEPALAELLLGIARFEQGDFAASRVALEKAAASDKTRAEAREWLEELDAKKK
jgi:tetratricopeptide (TPR) repeat protein